MKRVKKTAPTEASSPKSELERLIAADREDKARESKVLNRSAKKDKRRKVVLISAASVLAVAVIGGAIVYDPFTNSLRFGEGPDQVAAQGPDSTNNTSGEEEESSPGEARPWYLQAANLYPIELEDWQKKEFNPEDTATLDAIDAKEAYSQLGAAAMILPAEEAGFVSDNEQAYLEDGSPNPLYSFWTAEVFRTEVGSYLETFLNPRFGGWESSQFTSLDFDPAKYQTMFTSRWLSEDGADSTRYPFYIDWSNSDYGMGDQLTNGARWYGEVQSINTNFIYNEEEGQYQVELTAAIKYTAWKNDQSKIEKNGNLSLTLVANPEQVKGESPNRVLIDAAKLEVS